MSEIVSTLKHSSIPYALNNDWTWCKWSDIIESYQQGLIRSNSQLNDEVGVEYFKMSFINEDGSYTFNSLPRTFATEKEIEDFRINSGDFFINVRNSKELVGKSCVVYDVDRDILFNHMLVRIKHKSYISGAFINAYLNTAFGKKLLSTCKKGTTTVIALYQKDLYELPIPIPKRELFERIDNIYNDINKKIALNNQVNAELEQMAKRLYDYWFVQFNFPNVEGKPYKSSKGKMVYNTLLKREIPEGWEIGTLEDLAFFNPTLSLKRNQLSPYLDMASLPTVGYMTQLPQLKEFAGGVKFQNGDILVARITPCLENGKTGYVTMLQNDIIGFGSTEFINIRGKSRENVSFLSILSRSESFRRYAISKMTGTSGRKRVEAKQLSKYCLTIPPRNLLQSFGKIVDPFFEKMTTNQKQNQELSALRDWLLPMLINGQVKVIESSDSEEAQVYMAAEPQMAYGTIKPL